MKLLGSLSIESVAQGLGVVAGVTGLVTVLFKINNIYNHLVTTDTLIRTVLAEMKERMNKIDDDVRDAQQENRDARAYIQDRLLSLENRIYRGDWKMYVDKGIISQEQLTRIRQLEK